MVMRMRQERESRIGLLMRMGMMVRMRERSSTAGEELVSLMMIL